MTTSAPQKEYAKCLCPSCYVMNCEKRKKPRDARTTLTKETHFQRIDSF